MIDSSPSIPTKLWLRPKEQPPTTPYAFQPPPNSPPIDPAHWHEHQHLAYYHAPILLNPLPFSPTNVSKIPEIRLGPGTNTLMCSRIRRRQATGIRMEHGNDYLYHQDPAVIIHIFTVAGELSRDDVAYGRLEQVLSRREASWRRMFLTLPPNTTTGLHVTLSTSPGIKFARNNKTHLARVACVRDLDGVKVGMLEDVARRAVESVVRHALTISRYASVEAKA